MLTGHIWQCVVSPFRGEITKNLKELYREKKAWFNCDLT